MQQISHHLKLFSTESAPTNLSALVILTTVSTVHKKRKGKM